MEGKSTDELFTRGCSRERNRSKSSTGRSISNGIYKSLEKNLKVYWRCGKEGHYRKQCRSEIIERGKEFEDAPSIE